jgi:hypothetical protein
MNHGNSLIESQLGAMREALLAAMQSHAKLGKAKPCDCSLCEQVSAALRSDAGANFGDRIREECAQIADWKAAQLQGELSAKSLGNAEPLKAGIRAAREISDRIRVLKTPKL